LSTPSADPVAPTAELGEPLASASSIVFPSAINDADDAASIHPAEASAGVGAMLSNEVGAAVVPRIAGGVGGGGRGFLVIQYTPFSVGCMVGDGVVGTAVGAMVGAAVGAAVGDVVGAAVGVVVGAAVGTMVVGRNFCSVSIISLTHLILRLAMLEGGPKRPFGQR
jgi:hypothetical protein